MPDEKKGMKPVADYYRLVDLVDLSLIRKMVDVHYQAAGVALAIVDALDGSILVGAGWQDICVKFHRASPAARKRCEESDNYIKGHLREGETYAYKCANGLWDIGIPIIVAGRHFATIFFGQFFYEGEPPDREFFKRQASELGYAEDEYLAALDRVPVISRANADSMVTYIKALAGFISDLAEHALWKIRTEKELLFSKAVLKAQQETSPDGILVTDAGRDIISINKMFVDMWGIPADIAASKSMEGVQRAVRSLLARPDELVVLEKWVYEHPDRKSINEIHLNDGRIFEQYSSPMFGPDGTYYGRVWHSRDITGRRKAEEDLRQASLVVENSPAVLFRWKAAEGWPVELVSRNVAQFGYASGDFLSGAVTYASIIYPDDLKRIFAEVQEYAAAKGVDRFRQEYRIVTRDGKVRWVDDHTAIERDAGGRITHYQGIILDITERKDAEQALRQNEERYRLLVETMNDGLLVMNKEGLTTYVNTRLAEMLGRSRDEILGHAFTEFMDDENRRIVEDQIQRRKKGETAAYEITGTRKDGCKTPVIISPRALIDEKGVFAGSFAIITDITDRRRAEEELKKSEAALQSILRSSPSGIALVSYPGRRYLYVNDRFCEMCGYAREEIIGRNSLFIFPDVEEYERVGKTMYAEIIRSGIVFMEMRWRHKNGTVFNALMGSTPLDRNDITKGVSVTVQDITERKKAEEALRKSEATLQSILRSSPSGVGLVSYPERKFLYVNDRFREITGYEREEIVGQSVRLVYAGDAEYEHAGKTLYPEMQRSGIAVLETRMRRKDGKKFDAQLCTAPLDMNDISKGISVTLQDITGRKRGENALRQSEERYRNVFENAPFGIFRADAAERLIDVNDAFARMFGYGSREEIIADVNRSDNPGLKHYVHPEQRPSFDEEDISPGAWHQFEAPFRRKDGSVNTCLLRFRKLHAPDDRGAVFEGFLEDITERRRAEAAWLKEKEFSDSLVQNSPAYFTAINCSGKTIMMNPAMLQTLGRTQEEVAQTDYLRMFIPENERERLSQAFARLVKSREPVIVESRVLTKDGGTRLVEWHGKSLFDNDGNCEFFFGVGIDITERRKAEAALKESYGRLKGALEGIINAITVIVEIRDPYTAGHQKRVSRLACAIAVEMGLPQDKVDSIRIASVLHDIGKVYVPAEILSKPGNLSWVEMEIVKGHPRASYEILKMIDFPWPVAEIAFQHQERYDGTGYPRGLAGDNILPEARILAVADTIEAMMIHRPYRDASGLEKALDEITRNRGAAYDPDVVDAAVRLLRDRQFTITPQESPAEAVPAK